MFDVLNNFPRQPVGSPMVARVFQTTKRVNIHCLLACQTLYAQEISIFNKIVNRTIDKYNWRGFGMDVDCCAVSKPTKQRHSVPGAVWNYKTKKRDKLNHPVAHLCLAQKHVFPNEYTFKAGELSLGLQNSCNCSNCGICLFFYLRWGCTISKGCGIRWGMKVALPCTTSRESSRSIVSDGINGHNC